MADRVTIDDRAVKDALNKLDDATAGRKLVMALRAGALVFMNKWKELAPFRTGTYRRSIHAQTEQITRDNAAVFVGSGIEQPNYPAFLEYGAGWIEPINAKALHFFVEGREVFAARVYQPAHPSMGPAWDDTQDEVVNEIGETIRQLAGL